MAITFSCHSCGTQYSVKDEFAGKKTRCRKCNNSIDIPLAGADADDPPDLGFLQDGGSQPLSRSGMGESTGASSSFSLQSLIRKSENAGEKEGDLAMHAASASGAGLSRPSRKLRLNSASMEGLSPLIVLAWLGCLIAGTVMAYLHFPGEALLTKIGPEAQEAITETGKPLMAMAYSPIVLLIAGFALLGPAIMLGWFITSKIFKSELPTGLYMRSIGLAVMPLALISVLQILKINLTMELQIFCALGCLPLAWLMVQSIHGERLVPAAVVVVLGAVFYIPAMIGAISIADKAAASPMLAWENKVTTLANEKHVARTQQAARDAAAKIEAERVAKDRGAETAQKEREKQIEAARQARLASLTGGTTPNGTPNVTIQRTPIEALQDRVVSERKLAEAALYSREQWDVVTKSVAARFEELRAGADPGVVGALEADLALMATLSEKLPSEALDASLNEAPAETMSLTPDTDKTRPEASVGPFNLRPPYASTLLGVTEKSGQPPTYQWKLSGGTLSVRAAPAPSDKQIRAGVRPEALRVTDRPPEALVITAPGQPTVSYQKLGDLLLTVAGGETKGAAQQVYATRSGTQWIILEYRADRPIDTTDRANIAQFAASLRVRGANEATVDPMSPAYLIPSAAADPAEGAITEPLLGWLRADKTSEAALLGTLGAFPSDKALEKWSQILPVIASEKSTRLLWLLVEKEFNADAAKAALKRVDPGADDLTFATMGLKGKNDAVRASLKTLANAPLDIKRKPDISKALTLAAADSSFFLSYNAPETQEALAKWGDDKLVARFISIINDPNAGESERRMAIGTLSYLDQPKNAALIAKWVLLDTDLVVESLTRMKNSSENVAINLLGEKEPEARIAGAKVLAQVGTKKCVPALQRAGKDARDPRAAAAADAAYEVIRERLATPAK